MGNSLEIVKEEDDLKKSRLSFKSRKSSKNQKGDGLGIEEELMYDQDLKRRLTESF